MKKYEFTGEICNDCREKAASGGNDTESGKGN